MNTSENEDDNKRLVDLTILPGQIPDEDPKKWLMRMSIGKLKLPGYPRRGLFNRRDLPDRWEKYKCYNDIIRMKEDKYTVPVNWGGNLLGILPCKVPLMEDTFRSSIYWSQKSRKARFQNNPLIDESQSSYREDGDYDWVIDKTINNSLLNHIHNNLAYRGHPRGSTDGTNALCSELKENYNTDKLKIGLIINLTATPRYTDSSILRTWGIENKQIVVAGGGAVPTPKVVWEFLETMRAAGKQLPAGNLILIHCTHGVNRTGFFIGLWMILACNMKVDEYIHMFEERRGHRMDRPELIELLRRYYIHLRSIPVKVKDPLMDIIPRMWSQIANLYIHQDNNLQMKHLSPMEEYLCLTRRHNNLWKVYTVVIGPLPIIFKYYMVNIRSTLDRLMQVFNGRIEKLQVLDDQGEILRIELSVSWPSYANESYFDFIFDYPADDDNDKSCLTPMRPYLNGFDQHEMIGGEMVTESFDVVNLMAVLSLLSWNITETIPEEERAYDFHYEGSFVSRNFKQHLDKRKLGFNEKLERIKENSKDICTACNRRKETTKDTSTTNSDNMTTTIQNSNNYKSLENKSIPILIQIVKGLTNKIRDLPDKGQHWYTVASQVRHAKPHRKRLPTIDLFKYTLVHYQGYSSITRSNSSD